MWKQLYAILSIYFRMVIRPRDPKAQHVRGSSSPKNQGATRRLAWLSPAPDFWRRDPEDHRRPYGSWKGILIYGIEYMVNMWYMVFRILLFIYHMPFILYYRMFGIWYMKIRILQSMIVVVAPFYWALEPEWYDFGSPLNFGRRTSISRGGSLKHEGGCPASWSTPAKKTWARLMASKRGP